MSVYSYRAISPAQEVVRGEIAASGEAEALKKIQALKLMPVEVRPKGGAWRRSFRGRRIKTEDLMVAFRELALMFRSGVPILRALRILVDSNKDRPLGTVFENIYEDTKRGDGLAAAMEKQNRVFSRIVVNMVRTGEKSGRLAEVLLSVSKDLEHAVLVGTEVRNALAYPAFLLTMSGLALVFMFTTVIPKFAAIIERLDVELPAASRMVLAAGGFLRRRWPLVLAAFLVLGILTARAWKKESVRRAWGRLLLKLPVVRTFLLYVELSRFAHALAVLLQSGVEIIQSLRMSVEGMGNAYLREKFSGVADRLKRGESLYASLQAVGVFPNLAVHMIEVGEETGALPAVLDEMSTLFVEKFRSSMKRMISLLEPAIIVVVGAIIGFIVISLLSVIMSLNDVRF